jgi:hypothetical protein
MDFYKREEIEPGLFRIKTPYGDALKNHNNTDYPLLSENISRNLIGDLNAICDFRLNGEKGTANEDLKLENVLLKLSGQELRESFSYCILSSLMVYEEKEMDAVIEIEASIQWDRLFLFLQPHLKN